MRPTTKTTFVNGKAITSDGEPLPNVILRISNTCCTSNGDGKSGDEPYIHTEKSD